MDYHIIMTREPSQEDYTFGEMVAGDFKCLTIEDEHRDVKVSGETRIPGNGTVYQIILRKRGGMHQRCLEDVRFKHFHDGMLWLRPTNGDEEITNANGDVWTYCYIHWGVTDDHTDGCIIVGATKIDFKGQPGLGYSTATYEKLYCQLLPCLRNPEDRVFLTVNN